MPALLVKKVPREWLHAITAAASMCGKTKREWVIDVLDRETAKIMKNGKLLLESAQEKIK